MLEALICGDTRIPASELHQAVQRLKQKDEANEGKTGFERQFEVNNLFFPFGFTSCVVANEGLHVDSSRLNPL